MILTLDIGTTRIKAGIFSLSGKLLECSSIKTSGKENGGCSVEADPADILVHLAELTSSLTKLSACTAACITANGPTLIPVLGNPYVENGRLKAETESARLWLDRRAAEESVEVTKAAGDYVDPSFFIPKALYYARKQPEAYKKTLHLMFLNDFIDFILTGSAKTIFPAEGLDRWYWDKRLLDTLGLDPEKFPEFIRPGDYVGEITADASGYFGIPAGIPLYAGAPDFFVSILGTGAVVPGSVCNRSGTSEGINVCTTVSERDTRLMCYRHPVSEYYNISGIISTSGKAIGWARELLGFGDKPFEEFYNLVSQSSPGAGNLIFLPYLAGERAPIWDPHACGVLNGLKLATNRADIARSVCEGVCFAIRDVIEVMEDLGHQIQELRVTGGPAESSVLNQMKADITGKPVIIPAVSEAELVGCLIIAATGLGLYESFREAAEELVGVRTVFHPDTSYAQDYERLFHTYRNSYAQLKDEFCNLCEGEH